MEVLLLTTPVCLLFLEAGSKASGWMESDGWMHGDWKMNEWSVDDGWRESEDG